MSSNESKFAWNMEVFISREKLYHAFLNYITQINNIPHVNVLIW